MKKLTCDACGHEIESPSPDRNYFHIEDWDVCEPCKESIEMEIRPIMRGKVPFDYDWYRDLMIKSIAQHNAKLKGDVKRGR
ncbi:MAG TPA: hypothetical protein VMV83_08340 [Rectinemataceae bacterium]|nr:hypothetical protein [Rectinemataceae bacterium]